MSHPTARHSARLLSAAFALALAVMGFLLPARPVSATGTLPTCPTGYAIQLITYFSSAAHTTIVGSLAYNCSTGEWDMLGKTSIYSSAECEVSCSN
jgi:hypothetical protein